MILGLLSLLVIVIVSILFFLSYRKKKAREKAKALLTSRSIYVIRAYDIIPSSLSKVVDNPEGLDIISAAIGVASLYVYYVLIMGLPIYTALVGLILALAPNYIIRVFTQVLDIVATLRTLSFLNVLVAMLSAPNATPLNVPVEKLEIDGWLKVAYKYITERGTVMFPSLPKVTGLWQTIASTVTAEAKSADDALGNMLTIQMTASGQMQERVESLSNIIQNLAGFMMPAAIGLGMFIVVASLMTGLPGMTAQPMLPR